MNPVDLRYPIGRFSPPAAVDADLREKFIAEIAAAPSALRRALEGLSQAQLDTCYREGGWTVRQVAHHLPDSHINAYVRFKLALTEDRPSVKTYEEARWAEIPEARFGPVETSLALLDALHTRWVAAIRSLGAEEFERTFCHPEMGELSIDRLLALYAWHGRHHVAQITSLRSRMGWD